MSDYHRDREYTERCPCGRVLVTPNQAAGHTRHCDELPGDSLLLRQATAPNDP